MMDGPFDLTPKKEKAPFFSVIVPANNSETFIRKGLESVTSQDFTDWELIVICDSCTDLTEVAALDYTTKVITTNFHSGGGARNVGLDKAKGEWILFMDDDDWFLPGAFRKIAEEIRKHTEIDILAYGFEWKHRGIALQNWGRKYPSVWNKAWRRDFIGDKRFPVWCHTEDVEFNRRVYPGAWWAFLPEALYHYEFMRPGSVSDRIRNGEFDNSTIPESCRSAAEGYERWLKEKY